MVRGLCLVLLFTFIFLLIVPFVLAQDEVNTQITVKTYPNSRIWLIIKDQATMRTIGTFNTTISSDGQRILNFESTDRMLAFVVNVYESDSLVESKNFSGFVAGNPVTLDLNAQQTAGGNVSGNVTGTSQNINGTNETAGGGTGNVVSENKLDLKIVYSVGGVILVLIIVFVVYNVMQKRTGGFTITKLSERLGKEKEAGKFYSNDKELREAEKKLQEVQGELERIKKIKEAERKFEEAKKELEKLKRN